MNGDGKRLSERIEEIVQLAGWCRQEYQDAQQAVKQEDARLQDFLHAIEFAADKNERNRLVTRLRESRIQRRKSKDRILELEFILQYLNDPAHKKAINGLSQLLGNQRKREAYLNGDRKYHNRVTEEKNQGGKTTSKRKFY